MDDIILTGDDEVELKKIKSILAREFETKDLGKLKILSWGGSGLVKERNHIILENLFHWPA